MDSHINIVKIKEEQMKIVLRMGIALLLAGLFVASPCTAAEVKPETKAEFKAFLDQYRKAFNEKNADAVMAMYASDAVLIGTGPGELYEGSDDIRKAHVEFFKSFDKEERTIQWMKVGTKGNVAWIAATVKFNSYIKDKKTEFLINSTSVLEKRDGKWVIVVRHFSNLVTDKK